MYAASRGCCCNVLDITRDNSLCHQLVNSKQRLHAQQAQQNMDSPQEEWVSLVQKNTTGLIRLQMSGSSKRLNQIDRIRAKGVGDHISLPQLVVCGDQSAGKSSVLEGITGVPFPRQDGVCTRFATEIILRHCPDKNEIIAKLLPSVTRTEEERLRMTSFEHQLTGFDDLPGSSRRHQH